ncbi:membrane protein [Rhynchospora pubera]|uniref:Membrane protein n=1 Tax=Rhynchospora pubera TaxID=906938 RepID=A0AAV8GL51_9POAL|nr:membrane protein [Rhynchospora pubera]KAJ4776857.1 membrane protein [Rhynchospora pubera]KAJ4804027.1 membrane protein [Rhynchospora pubera]
MATSNSPLSLNLFLFLLLFPSQLTQSQPLTPSETPNPKSTPEIETQLRPSSIDRQEALINRLETLISTLEQSIANSKPKPKPDSRPSSQSANPKPAISVTKSRPLFTERFLFSAAAKLSASAPSAATPLPFVDPDSLTKYFAIGDSLGTVYIFSCTGDVILELPCFSNSSVTALLSYLSPTKRSECLLFVGHADGSIGAHRLSESALSPDSDWVSLYTVGEHRVITRGLDNSPVTVLEFFPVARSRYIITGDAAGRIRVFTENGTLYGTAIVLSKPVAFMKQRLLFLTETGAASLELRSMTVRETECEGLNGSVARAYTFDLSERSKAYGLTREGDLVHLVILGDVSNLKCRVRSVRRAEIQGPASIQTIKGGYLLVASHDKFFVYNISSQYYGRVGAPRPLFFTSIREIKSLFLNSDPGESEAVDGETDEGKPLIATDRDKLVILGFRDGYIGIYKSNFPIFRPDNSVVLWSGPALLFLLFLIGIWQFYVKKKDSLGWVPDDSFDTSVAPSGSLLNSTERAGLSDSRTGRELRVDSTDLRRDARRYLSPSRYTGLSSSISYRPVSGDTGLNYRGQGLEPPGLIKKRDPLFTSTQLVDEHAD